MSATPAIPSLDVGTSRDLSPDTDASTHLCRLSCSDCSFIPRPVATSDRTSHVTRADVRHDHVTGTRDQGRYLLLLWSVSLAASQTLLVGDYCSRGVVTMMSPVIIVAYVISYTKTCPVWSNFISQEYSKWQPKSYLTPPTSYTTVTNFSPLEGGTECQSKNPASP